jgi:TRAP-type C4-dicarboxylate transport system substrate-binding protein
MEEDNMNKKSYRIVWALGVACMLTLLATPGIAADASPVTLKYSTYVTEKSWHGEMHSWWANEVDKRTEGKVKIKTFWMESLTKHKDGLQAVQTGMTDLTWLSSTYHPSQLPLFMITDNPGNFGNDYVAAVLALYDTMDNQKDLKAELERENIVQMMPHISGHTQLMTKKCFSSLAELKGKTLRTYGGARAKYYETLGANPIFMPYPDIYEAVDRGTISAFDGAIVLSNGFKHYEVAKCIHLINAGGSLASGVFMNLKTFKGLPPAIQKTLLDLRKEYGTKMAQKQYDDEQVYYKEWNTKYNVVTRNLSDADQKTNISAIKTAQDYMVKKQESDGHKETRKVWDYYTTALKKYETERAKKK